MLTGQDLADARTRARLTQQQLAEQIGVSQRSVGNWERSSSVPKGAESKVRDALSGHLGDQPDPLSSVSDARLLAEIAKRFDRTRRDGEGNVSPSTSTDQAAPQPPEITIRRGGRRAVVHEPAHLDP